MTGAATALVVGAGPAGLAATAEAARLGLRVRLVDEQPAPGGQIYRGIGRDPTGPLARLDSAYYAGRALTAAAAGVAYEPSTTVWHLSPQGDVGTVGPDGDAVLDRADAVILATGAVERPFPIPGWTLPGVTSAGGLQTLIKQAALVPEGRLVLAGSGPLLYLVTRQLASAGVPPALVLDTTPPGRYRAALSALGRLAACPAYARKGLGLLLAMRGLGRRYVTGVERIEAVGEGRLTAVRFAVGGREREVAADHLALHHGILPGLNLALAAGCDVDWNDDLHGWQPRVDAWGESGRTGILVAGDGAAILGAEAAAAAGRLAAIAAARRLGHIGAVEADGRGAPLHRLVDRYRRVRPLLDRLYAPAPAFLAPAGDTLVCRCESVAADTLRRAVRDGCTTVDLVKQHTRCGMGPCQGRMCGATTAEVVARERGIPVRDVGLPRQRAPVTPLPLSSLAGLRDVRRERPAARGQAA